VVRSTDAGNTWSAAIPMDAQHVASVQIAGQAVRSSDFLPEFAANFVNGNVFSVWQDALFSATGDTVGPSRSRCSPRNHPNASAASCRITRSVTSTTLG
jgi:hypothetical protein